MTINAADITVQSDASGNVIHLDRQPDPFIFTDQPNVDAGATVTSNAITVEGIHAQAESPINVSTGTYSIDGGAFTPNDGLVSLNQTVIARHIASLTEGAQVNQAVTIGGQQDIFTSTVAVPTGTVLWDEPAFLGFTKTTGTATLGGTIYTDKTSGDAPLVVHASASAVTVSGVTETYTGNGISPYMHLEHRWATTKSDLSAIVSDGEITNPNTLTPVNMYTDQVGGEACFIYHEPGTYTLSLTTTAVNGDTQTLTETITVNIPTYAQKWFDPDNGSDLNDGFQHWDASALTAGTYTESNGEISQPGSGAFTNYDHIAATTETYQTDRYNWGWFDWGVSSGWLRIQSKTNNDTVVIHPDDRIGSNQTGVTSSSGPKETFTAATDIAANTAHYLKVGRTYALSSSITASTGNGIRLMGWGGSGQFTLQSQIGTGNMVSLGGSIGDWLSIHRGVLDANGTSGFSAECVGGGPTEILSPATFLLDRCECKNSNQDRLASSNYGTTVGATTTVFWGTTWDHRGGLPVETKASNIFWRRGDLGHTAAVGCRYYSDPVGNATFDHYSYYTGSHDHRLRSYNDWPGTLSASEMGFCFNENSSNVDGDVQRYMCYWGNRFRNALAGIDPANVNSTPPANFENGTIEDLVAIGNSFEGDGTSANFYIGVFPNDGLETAFIGHNVGINLFRGVYEPGGSRSQNRIYMDGNICYNSRVMNANNQVGNYQVVNTVSHDTSATAVSLAWDSVDNGAETHIRDNNFYAPNDGNPILNAGVQETIAALNAAANNSGNTGTSPGFTDPASNDFRTAADVKFDIQTFTLPDPIGGSITIPLTAGFGVPKGIIVVQSGDNGAGNGYNNGSYCIGYSDGTNEICAYAMHDSEAAGPTQDCFRSGFETVSVRTQTFNNNSMRNNLTAVGGLNTDEVVLTNTSDFDTEPRQGFIIAIGGNDVESLTVGTGNLGTGTSAVPFTVGHETDVLYTLSTHATVWNTPTSQANARDPGVDNSHGVAINDGFLSQTCQSWASANAVNPAQNTHAIYDNSVLASIGDGATENWRAPVTAFTATGFEITPTASAGSSLFGYMSIKFAKTVNMTIVNTSIPTGGIMSVTGAGFTPSLGMAYHTSGLAAYNTPTDMNHCIAGTFFDANTMRTYSVNGKDGDVSGENNDLAAWAREDSGLALSDPDLFSGSLDVQSSGYVLNSDGLDITLTNWPDVAIPGRMLLLGVS